VNSTKRSWLAEIGLPVLAGVLIEVSSDLLKLVTHYISGGVEGADLRDPEFWLGMLIAIGFVAASLWILESWTKAHPIRAVRIGVVILSIIVAAIVDPFGRAFKGEIYAAYDKAQTGESMAEVLDRFQHDTGILVEPNKDLQRHSELDCIGECWLRLRYNVPMFFGEHWVTLEFGRNQKLIRKCDLRGDCSPPRSTEPSRNPHG
jgi:hypothetical protein